MQKPLSYIAGWLSALAWCCGTTSGFFLAGSLIQGVIVELHDSYTAEPWRAYLLVLCLATLGALVNTYLSRKLPKLEGLAFVLTIAGFVSIIIVLWVLNSNNRLSASEVWSTFDNEGGWSSLGLSMVAGQILMVWTLTGKLMLIEKTIGLLLKADRLRCHRTYGRRNSPRFRRYSQSYDSELHHQRVHGVFDAHHVPLLSQRPGDCL